MEGVLTMKLSKRVIEKGLKKKVILISSIPKKLFNLFFFELFHKEEVTDLSGRGVGMDAVKEEVEKLGGKFKSNQNWKKGRAL